MFLHGRLKTLHRNVCPASIIITKRGTWKLSGLEFIGESVYLNTIVPSRVSRNAPVPFHVRRKSERGTETVTAMDQSYAENDAAKSRLHR